MKNFEADKFFVLSQNLGALEHWFLSEETKTDMATEVMFFTGKLKFAQKECIKLGFKQSEKLIDRSLKSAESKFIKIKDLAASLGAITALIHSEMEEHRFLFLPPESAEFYEQKEPLFGQKVFDAFPSLIDDVAEAGKCLALDRGTACVFHLMRVMEGGLRALAKPLGIPYAPSWESYIKLIGDKISAKHKTKGIRWKRDEPFFKDVLGDLTAVKMAWRNPTMHIVKTYDVKQAENVLTAVRAFMQHLATRLKEVPRV